ncbi:hypothetical protein AMTRI_Chr12g238780 [Amborella trichopoda]
MTIDTLLSGWIMEFLLDQRVEDWVINSLICVLPLSDRNLFLKKLILLQRLSSDMSKGLITERILDSLEMMSELERGNQVSENFRVSLSDAYVAVAAECSVRFLREESVNSKEYLETLRRIWEERIAHITNEDNGGFVSARLKELRVEFEAAVDQPHSIASLLSAYKYRDALNSLNRLLAVARNEMGPSFLELAAEAACMESGDLLIEGEEGQIMEKVGNDEELADLDAVGMALDNTHKTGVPVNEELSTPSIDMRKRGSFSREEFVLGEHLMEGMVVVESRRNRVLGKEDCIHATMHSTHIKTVFEDPLPDARQTAAQLGQRSTTWTIDRTDESSEDILNQIDVEKRLPLNAETGDKESSVHSQRNQMSGKAKLLHTKTHTNLIEGNKYDRFLTPEVSKVQEALKRSSLNLQTVVEDPLPNALEIAAQLSMESKTDQTVEEGSGETQDQIVAGEHQSVIADKGNEARSMEEVRTEDQGQSHRVPLPRPSLMAWNSTACAQEWDDGSIESLSEESTNHSQGIHLPSPRTRHVSPLRMDEAGKRLMKRKNKKWTLLEEETLREAVNKYGQGNWKLILNCYSEIFDGRTQVNLKDKWRTMMNSKRGLDASRA